MNSITVAVGLITALSGLILGWLGKARAVKKDITAEVTADIDMKKDVEYIKRGVDEMRLEQKDQGRRFDALSERVTRVEESAKQAHHRLNRLEGEGKQHG